jgi:hypothetical protein
VWERRCGGVDDQDRRGAKTALEDLRARTSATSSPQVEQALLAPGDFSYNREPRDIFCADAVGPTTGETQDDIDFDKFRILPEACRRSQLPAPQRACPGSSPACQQVETICANFVDAGARRECARPR